MSAIPPHLSLKCERALSTNGALCALAFGLIGLIYGGFAIMKMMPHSSGFPERDMTLRADGKVTETQCTSRMMQLQAEAYDPRLYSCVIPQSDASIWSVHGRWHGAREFIDRQAQWMGPGPRQKRADGTEFCAELMGTETALFARTVTLSRAERVKVEAFIDEDGRLVIEHLESGRVLLDQKLQDKRLSRSVTLPRGTVRILVEASDQDTSTGILFSLRGRGRQALALSGEPGWCIFRLDSSLTLRQLLERFSSCHPCLGGASSHGD